MTRLDRIHDAQEHVRHVVAELHLALGELANLADEANVPYAYLSMLLTASDKANDVLVTADHVAGIIPIDGVLVWDELDPPRG